MPSRSMFTSLFGQSPISELQVHMEKADECAGRLPDFFRAAFADDWEGAREVYDGIYEIEAEADAIKRGLRLRLPRSLFLPVSRSDVLELVRVQDQIPNNSKDIAGIVLGRRMKIPESLQADFGDFVATSLEAVQKTRSLVASLGELLETGFSNREAEKIEAMIASLGESEHNSDEKQVLIRRNLFELESQLNAVDVMFLYQVIDLIGDLADHAETVGNRVLYVIAR